MRTLLMTFVLFDVVAVAAGSPELLVAIRNSDHARVQKLLDSGADPNTADADGTTALMHSVVESDVKMMKLLVDKGANVNTKNCARFDGVDVCGDQSGKDAGVAGCAAPM